MAFPINPIEAQEYTSAVGTRYRYYASSGAWKIVSQEIQGYTGAQGVTGLQGITGISGLGTTGAQGITGIRGTTGMDLTYRYYNAGSFAMTGAVINWGNGNSQKISMDAGGETGVLWFTNGLTGSKYSLEIVYTRNVVPRGYTGMQFIGGSTPILSGQTGVIDLLSTYFNGSAYLTVETPGFKY